MSEDEFLRLLPVAGVPLGGYVMARIGAYDVLVCNVEGEVCVIEDRCSHMLRPLNGGRIVAGRITCPEHGAEFDVRSGAAVCLPASRPLRRFGMRVRDGFIEVAPEPMPAPAPPAIRPFGM